MRRFSAVKRAALLALAAMFMLSVLGCEGGIGNVYLSADISAKIVINEVVSSNAHSLIDPNYGAPDWVELYNASDEPVNLAGYGLTDNIKKPLKWTFPDVTIDAHGYLVVYAANGNDASLFTGFGMSKRGDSLYLSDNYLNLLCDVQLPALLTDVSYARTADGKYGYCISPTPNAENTTPVVFTEAELIELYDGRTSSSDALAITEVMPENKTTLADADGNYLPWAELYNKSDAMLDLSAYFLSDDAANLTKFQLPSLTLAPGERMVVFLSDAASDAVTHTSFTLGSADDTLYLADNGGALVCSVTWPLGLCDDISVLPDGLFTAFPTPGADNSNETFSNSEPVAMDATDPIRINEALVRNKYSVRDKDGDRSSWVELCNYSQSAVSLLGYYLSDEPTIPYKWAVPDVTMEPGAYLVIFTSGKDMREGELHTSFTLSRNDDAILLSNKNGLREDKITFDAAIKDNASFGLGDDFSLYYYSTPTPGAKNSTHAFSSLDELSFIDTNGVYITEVSAAHAPKSGLTDWIELYNGSSETVNLEGWYLSDDIDDPCKFTFPELCIESGGYAAINATTRTAKMSSKSVSVPFGISECGETLILTKPSGLVADIYETGALRADITSGRLVGSDARVFFKEGTKGKRNETAALTGFAAEPVFSDIELYHTDSFTLTLSCATPGATIRYTLDGSKPTTESAVYAGGITISGNTPVRAYASCDGLADSDIATYTYLFVEPHTVPVVCISADQAAFDEMYAVIDRWKKIEREAHISYYEADGKLGVSFGCGLRAAGASTLLAAQKSMSVMLRTGYGMGEVSYPFFENSDVTSYSGLVLRTSGQDRERARIRDSFFMKAVKGLNIEYVETRLTVVYVNGAYWGIYDLNENQNEDYMAAHYGVDPDAVDIIRRNETRLEGDKYEFKRVRAYGLETDLSDDAKYAQFTEWVDVDYFIDYLIAQTYFSNGDMFNQKYWRSQDYTVKWRPVYFDIDFGLSASSPSRNILPSYFTYAGVPSQDGSLTNMDIFVGLRKNQGWCDKFCERYVYVVLNYFTDERLLPIYDAMADTLRAEMPRHIKRWHEAPSMSKWEDNISALRKCLTERSEYALKYLQRTFNVPDATMQQYIANAKAGTASVDAAPQA